MQSEPLLIFIVVNAKIVYYMIMSLQYNEV